MARLLADEHFDIAVVNRLRRLGHDVETVRQLADDKSGKGMEDDHILRYARGNRRVVLTENVSDFKALHEARIPHAGIIACSPANKEPASARAARIDRVLRSHGRSIKQQFVRIHSWRKEPKKGPPK